MFFDVQHLIQQTIILPLTRGARQSVGAVRGGAERGARSAAARSAAARSAARGGAAHLGAAARNDIFFLFTYLGNNFFVFYILSSIFCYGTFSVFFCFFFLTPSTSSVLFF